MKDSIFEMKVVLANQLSVIKNIKWPEFGFLQISKRSALDLPTIILGSLIMKSL